MPGKNLRGGAGLALLLASSVGVLVSACLERPLCSDCAPKTTNQFVLRVPTGGIDKIDLLFVIDNSASMADKQAILRQAVPSLLTRFVNPLCVDEHGNPTGANSQAGACSAGVPEFPSMTDIHIGIVTSSLGAAGSDNRCGRDDKSTPDDESSDSAWLLPLARPGSGLDSWNQSGFLAWDPLGTKNQPAGTRDSGQLTMAFQNQVKAVGEQGCGFEATLESWYRFLIAPDPPLKVTRQGLASVAEGVDGELLKQRNAFLRADSLLAVVMLTDENDCSLVPAGPGYVVDDELRMPRATSTCATNPNDPCCRACGSTETTPPPNCVPLASDPECKINSGKMLDTDDNKNVRCWDQKQRFGLDLLEPTAKYVAGLTQATVRDRSGQEQPNPLFAVKNGKKRTPDLVYLAGIVGVPWQDIATRESLSGPNLRYMTAKELAENQRWDMILGDPKSRKPPTDPHMVESVSARTGSHPLLPNATLAPADAATPPTADVISGHEQSPPLRDDLQYACIFELETPVACGGDNGCDCPPPASSDPTDSQNRKRALCQPPSGGAFGTLQYYAKAYPGTRHLEVLKGLGEQAIVASICPKVVRSPNPQADANFGYNPAMAALVDRVGVKLANQCLARAPAIDAAGNAACVILEVSLAGACDCSGPGRRASPAGVLDSVRDDLSADKLCDNDNQGSCQAVCACQIDEAAGAAEDRCRAGAAPSGEQPGFCIVEPDKGRGYSALVRDCPSTARRLLRFVGQDTPRAGTLAYMACMGDTGGSR